jgi:Icc protein
MQAITRIAHLSDVHMLDCRPNPARARFATRYLSFGRPLEPALRLKRLTRALDAAKRSAADHVVISGDLTEIGAEEEYAAFADALDDAELDPENVTLVPGNHDAYSVPGAWDAATKGPLSRYARSSASTAGKVVDRGDVCILPLDVSRHQHFTRSSGEVTADMAGAVEHRASDPSLKKRTLVVVAHHPPFARGPHIDWLDGLHGGGRVMELLARHENVHALHGHLHSTTDRVPKKGTGTTCRIFGAPAVVEDEAEARVRIYEVKDGVLCAAGMVS